MYLVILIRLPGHEFKHPPGGAAAPASHSLGLKCVPILFPQTE